MGLIVVVLAIPVLVPAIALVLGGSRLRARRSAGGALGTAMVVAGVVWALAGLGLLVALLVPNL